MQSERFFWENNGYLVLESFLPQDLLERLMESATRAIEARREKQERGIAHTGMTHVQGESTRIFYILDDDPLFLEMMTYPPLMPYITTLLNPKPHHHASDLIVEHPQTGREIGRAHV